MYRFLIPLNRNPSLCLKYFTYFNRYYRTKPRKKVSIELNKPSLYDPKRNAPSKLLKANLFTPESAGYRELPMLCFWIVNYGYADSSILIRYVQCAIDNIKKLKIKSIALIFHSVSKYLYNSNISLVESHQIEGSDVEYRNRDILIKRCVLLILQSSPILPNLFVNAVPKDLGMLSLSIMNIYEMFLNECNIESLSIENKQTNIDVKNQHNMSNRSNSNSTETHTTNNNNIGKTNNNNTDNTDDNTNTKKSDVVNIKSIGSVVNKILQKLSKEIVPKLPFCEIDEFSAFAKSFSKINTDWSILFMRELSLEVSSLLLDKIEDLEMLSQNKFIGEDLIEELNKLPKELCTITCSLSKIKLNEQRFWERTQKVLDLLLELKNKNNNNNNNKNNNNFGIKDIDITTLTLLSTSMVNYCDVSKLVEEICSRISKSNETDQQSILIGFNISTKNLRNNKLAEKFLSKVDMNKIIDINPKLVSQFILNFSRSGLIDDLYDNDNTISSTTISNIGSNNNTNNTMIDTSSNSDNNINNSIDNNSTTNDNSRDETNDICFKIREDIVNMLKQELSVEILSSIYVSSRQLGLSMESKLDLCNKLSNNLECLETNQLVSILMNSIYMMNEDNNHNNTYFIDNVEYNVNNDYIDKNNCNSNKIKVKELSKSLSKKILDIINNRVDDIPLSNLTTILFIVVDYFGGNLELIKRLCSRIDQNINDFNLSEVSNIYDKLSVMGLNVNKLFNRNVNRIREYNRNKINTDITNNISSNTNSNIDINDNVNGNNFSHNINEYIGDVEYNYNGNEYIDLDNNNSNVRNEKGTSKVKFSINNKSEVSKIAEYTHSKTEDTKIFRSEDFVDEFVGSMNTIENSIDNSFKFELIKYPTNNIDDNNNNEFRKEGLKRISKSKNINQPSGTTIEDLKIEWSELRHNVQ